MNTTRTVRRLIALAALPLAAAAAISSAAPAQASIAGLPTVKICRDINYAGGCWESRDRGYQDFTDVRGTGNWNDQASSIIVDRGCKLTVYTDYNGYGLFQSWDAKSNYATAHTDGDNDLTSSWVGNDRISGVTIDCGM